MGREDRNGWDGVLTTKEGTPSVWMKALKRGETHSPRNRRFITFSNDATIASSSYNHRFIIMQQRFQNVEEKAYK